MLQVPLYKHILSYLYPVRIRKSSGERGSMLELFLYKGQYQLGTRDATYSDGRRYRPVLVMVDILKDKLKGVKSVLALGAGIGSIIDVLSYKGYNPEYTLVDIDRKILDWAEEIQLHTGKKIHTVCQDAQVFMQMNRTTYDLLFVDVFLGRVVPPFATSTAFIQECRRSINPGGYFIMNYIVNNETEWAVAEQTISAVFPSCQVYPLEVNRIIIASV